MTEQTSTSLVNLGNLTRPATTLIEKISDAVGVIYEPIRERRSAKARADADRIMAESEIEITDLQRRARWRRMEEDEKHQKNMEDITAKSLPDLKEDAQPESMDNDWAANFFDKARLVSDEEMQSLWARVLAGEANTPGTYSKRTVNFLTDLDRAEATLFTKLCGFVWMIGDIVPLVFHDSAEIYNRHGINFGSLDHLDSIGLVQFGKMMSFSAKIPKRFPVAYYGRRLTLEMPNDADNSLPIGTVTLTRTGRELAPLCGSQPVGGFWEYVRDQWKEYLPKAGTG